MQIETLSSGKVLARKYMRAPNISLVVRFLICLNHITICVHFRNHLTALGILLSRLYQLKTFVGRPLSVPNTFYWNATPWSLREVRFLKVSHRIKKCMQILGDKI